MRAYLFLIITSLFLLFTINRETSHFVVTQNTIQASIQSLQGNTKSQSILSNSHSQLHENISNLLFDFETDSNFLNATDDESFPLSNDFFPQVALSISFLFFSFFLIKENNHKKKIPLFHYFKYSKKFLEMRSLRI